MELWRRKICDGTWSLVRTVFVEAPKEGFLWMARSVIDLFVDHGFPLIRRFMMPPIIAHGGIGMKPQAIIPADDCAKKR